MNDYLENMQREILTPDHRPSYSNANVTIAWDLFAIQQQEVRDYFQKIIKVLKEDLHIFSFKTPINI